MKPKGLPQRTPLEDYLDGLTGVSVFGQGLESPANGQNSSSWVEASHFEIRQRGYNYSPKTKAEGSLRGPCWLYAGFEEGISPHCAFN